MPLGVETSELVVDGIIQETEVVLPQCAVSSPSICSLPSLRITLREGYSSRSRTSRRATGCGFGGCPVFAPPPRQRVLGLLRRASCRARGTRPRLSRQIPRHCGRELHPKCCSRKRCGGAITGIAPLPRQATVCQAPQAVVVRRCSTCRAPLCLIIAGAHSRMVLVPECQVFHRSHKACRTEQYRRS